MIQNMKITKEDLLSAAPSAGISPKQAEELWNVLDKKGVSGINTLLYYFGALIVLVACSWFLFTAWGRIGGLGIFATAVIYAFCFIAAGIGLEKYRIPSSLFFVLAICMTPIAIYGLELSLGMWAESNYASNAMRLNRIYMELGTIIAALIALAFVRFPFLTAPLFLALWAMAYDISPFILTDNQTFDRELRVSLWFGITMLVISYLIDNRFKEDYAFWGYLFGLLAFSIGLFIYATDKEWDWAVYGLINVSLLFLSLFLNRRTFMVFGAIGTFIYLAHLTYERFKDSLAFPLILSVIGIAIIYLGVLYQRHEKALNHKLLNLIPSRLRWILPQYRQGHITDEQ